MIRTACVHVATGLVLAFGGVAAAHPPEDETLAGLDRALVRDPADLGLRVRRAEARLRAGALELCAADLAEVLLRAPSRPDALVLSARLHLARGDRARARALLDRVLAAEPYAPAARDRDALRTQEGDLDGARADLDLALAKHPEPDGFLERARLDRARGDGLALVDGLADGARRTGAIVLVEAHVEALVEQRRTAEAIAAATAASERHASAPELLLLRARALEAAGDRAAALRDRQRALSEIDRALSHRDSDLLRLSRVRALRALGRTREARRLQAAIDARSPGLARAIAAGPHP